jgi:hypothetical protein
MALIWDEQQPRLTKIGSGNDGGVERDGNARSNGQQPDHYVYPEFMGLLSPTAATARAAVATIEKGRHLSVPPHFLFHPIREDYMPEPGP